MIAGRAAKLGAAVRRRAMGVVEADETRAIRRV
jgi:hypothetical protein